VPQEDQGREDSNKEVNTRDGCEEERLQEVDGVEGDDREDHEQGNPEDVSPFCDAGFIHTRNASPAWRPHRHRLVSGWLPGSRGRGSESDPRRSEG
jgi:hypothetical protein